jgi:hypothetical protein
LKEKTLRGNVQLKESMVEKLESLQPFAEVNENFEELKKIQQEWASLTEVPLKEIERLNNAFGRAAENFIERIKDGAQIDDKLFYRMKYEQMLKYPDGKESLKKLRFGIKDKINKLQSEVNQLENNLSFFGKSKKTNPLIAEYEQKLENSKQEINQLSLQLKTIPLESKE